MLRSFGLTLVLLSATAAPLVAQWTPSGILAGVPVSESCERTAGAPARAAEGPQIFTCASAIDAIEAEVFGASSFFLVHEYGHIALENENEAEADCWAAGEIGATPEGAAEIEAVVLWFEAHRDEFVENLGTNADRAASVESCSGLDFPPPPTGDSCCTAAGSCALSGDGGTMPLGAWCYCQSEDETIGTIDGEVCTAAVPENPA